MNAQKRVVVCPSPTCGCKFAVKADSGWPAVRCPKCKTRVKSPFSKEEAAEAEAEARREQQARREAEARREQQARREAEPHRKIRIVTSRPSDQQLAREYFDLFTKYAMAYALEYVETHHQKPPGVDVAEYGMGRTTEEMSDKYGLSMNEMLHIVGMAHRMFPLPG